MGRKHNHFGWRDLVFVITECSQSTLHAFKILDFSLNAIDIEGANSNIEGDLNMIGIKHD
jgi:hypothetical protein